MYVKETNTLKTLIYLTGLRDKFERKLWLRKSMADFYVIWIVKN